MAVLIEAISVVIRAEVLHQRYPGGWVAFAGAVPNQTLCADSELARIGFVVPSDVEAYVTSLREHDVIYQEKGKARDSGSRGSNARAASHVRLDRIRVISIWTTIQLSGSRSVKN